MKMFKIIKKIVSISLVLFGAQLTKEAFTIDIIGISVLLVLLGIMVTLLAIFLWMNDLDS